MDGPAPLPMMAPSSVQDLVHALRAAAQSRTRTPFFVLPYNRYEPANSEWWIAPTSENPAYHLGKIIVSHDAFAASPGERFVGLHVEKGVEGEATARYFQEFGDERSVMTDSWLWHDLMDALPSGQVERTAVAAERAAGNPLTVLIIASLHGLRDHERPEHRSEDSQADMVRLTTTDGRLAWVDEVRRHGRLDRLRGVTTFAALPDVLSTLPEVEVIWVEFLIGLRFAFAGGAGTQGVWNPQEVWERACQPWRDWLRSGPTAP